MTSKTITITALLVFMCLPRASIAADLVGKVLRDNRTVPGLTVNLLASCKEADRTNVIKKDDTNNLGVYVIKGVRQGWYGLRVGSKCVPVYVFQQNTEKNINLGAS